MGVAEAFAGARDDAGVTASHGRLNGISLFAMDHAKAGMFIIADKDGGLHIVETGAPGLTRVALTTIDVTRPVCELRFDNTPAEALTGDCTAALARMRDAGRVVLAADTLGAAWRMIEMAVDYAKQRKSNFWRALRLAGGPGRRSDGSLLSRRSNVCPSSAGATDMSKVCFRG